MESVEDEAGVVLVDGLAHQFADDLHDDDLDGGRVLEDRRAIERLAGHDDRLVDDVTIVFNALSNAPEDENDPGRERKALLAIEIGTSFAFERKDRQAEVWLKKAIALDSRRSSLAYQNLARLYLRRDADVEAYRMLLECRRLFPEDQDTYVLLATVYEHQGLIESGIAELEPLVKRGNAEPSVYSYLGCLFAYNEELADAEKVLREGHAKYDENYSIVHNLAYVLLMQQKLAEGKQLLETYKDRLEQTAEKEPDYRPALTATWGLLYLLDGSIDMGVRLYRDAAKEASRVGNRQLAGAVIQKMHIELAKHSLRLKDYESAKRMINMGLLVKRGREPFRMELKRLQSIEELQ